MLKKILIFALTLNTSHVLPSHSSYSPGENLGFGSAALVAGILCAWRVCKDFKEVWQASKEEQRQIEILHEIGVKVYRVSKSEFRFGSIVVKEHYTMEIPSNFSQQQEEKAKEHWSLLLANEKKANNGMSVLAGLGSLILIPAGVVGIIQGIQNFQ
jgi:hypothetical protein